LGKAARARSNYAVEWAKGLPGNANVRLQNLLGYKLLILLQTQATYSNQTNLKQMIVHHLRWCSARSHGSSIMRVAACFRFASRENVDSVKMILLYRWRDAAVAAKTKVEPTNGFL